MRKIFWYSVFSVRYSVYDRLNTEYRIPFLFLWLLLLLTACGAQAPRKPQVLYLWRDSAETQQLFTTTLAGETTQLTTADHNVSEVAVSPTGDRLAYVETLPSGATQLWLLENPRAGGDSAETPIDCSAKQCRNPVWAHDGRRLIYEQRNLAGDVPRLWWLDVETGDTLPVFSDETIIGYGARFSADSSKISYTQLVEPSVAQLYGEGHSAGDGHNHSIGQESNQQIIKLFDFVTGAEQAVPNLMNAFGEWHPTKPELLTTDMQFFNERFGVHVLHINQANEVVRDLGAGSLVEDSSPKWSPDGELIAFGRKQAQAPMGAQLWLMRADGSEAQALTKNADIHHGRLAWQPDGSAILFQRFDITSPQSEPSIWLYDIESQVARPLVEEGILPLWLP